MAFSGWRAHKGDAQRRLIFALEVVVFATLLGSLRPISLIAANVSPGNRFVYLDEDDPFYPNLRFPRLITPQWVGEEGVEAVVILAIDDMTETKRYEQFLRPILERLKQIDGRAPVSIMTRSVPPGDDQIQTWLKEGLTLEVHTVKHPCPLLAGGNFDAAAATYYECLDLLAAIPGSHPVAFRMPCCDSMDSASPRFFAEMLSRPSPKGNLLTIDSSVMNRFTTNDSSLPPELTCDSEGSDRFAKYFPGKTNAITRVSLGSFATTIENYPYPYVIRKLCWEFPCAVPSDWEAYNLHGSTNSVTLADWKAYLGATVLKRGVMTMVFHPYGWIRNDQMVELIDYAVSKYGRKIKFLNFKEAQERLNRNLLLNQPLKTADGSDNGVRVLDLNGGGFMDVVIANKQVQKTRVWDPAGNKWLESGLPNPSRTTDGAPAVDLRSIRFGVLGTNAVAFFRNENSKGAWRFDGKGWQPETNFFSGLMYKADPVLTSESGRDRGVRMRNLDGDGQCELIVGNEKQNAIYEWSPQAQGWKRLPYELPAGVAIVNGRGEDNGLRFVDLNGDGYDDLLLSNEAEYAMHLFIAKPISWLGWETGWNYSVRSGKRRDGHDIPEIVRDGEHRNNGAWFHDQKLFVQNEDTANQPDHVLQISFKDLLSGGESGAKSPEEALKTFRVRKGFRIELVASEPLIRDPVAFDWGADGKLWVVQMRDYPLGMDGHGKAGGVVTVLEDSKGDGHYDKATTFMEGLNFPNGIMPWRKGALISAAPDIIYAEDTDCDGKADVQKTLYTGFREGNQQHRINGFEYGLDNWLYMASGGSGGIIRSMATGKELELAGHDLRIRPDEGLMELQPGQTQFGRHRDDWGNWFGNDNSRWAWHYYLPQKYLGRNPHLTVNSTVRHLANYSGSNRLFPASAAQQRFNWPGALREVTSACSATPYRDELFGPEFGNSLFICEPANNLIHREVLSEDGVTFTSHRAPEEAESEFLASTDNWCRPVMVKTGPDGALYVADMYRLIIEHPEYFPEELKTRPDLRAGEDKGRIYRIYPEGAKLRKIPRLDNLSTADLARAMESPNGWQRDTVQRLLVERQDKAAIQPLIRILQDGQRPQSRLQALMTLDGLGAVTPELLLQVLQDKHWSVRRAAIGLSEPSFAKSSELAEKLIAMTEDTDIRVRYQLAFSLGEWHDSRIGTALARIALKDWDHEPMRIAVLSSVTGCVPDVLEMVLSQKRPSPMSGLVGSLIRLAAVAGNDKALTKGLGEIFKSGTEPELQIEAVGELLSGLAERSLSLDKFKREATPELQSVLAELESVFARAHQTAQDAAASESQRLSAIRLLGRGHSEPERDLALLGELLTPQNPSSIQKAAIKQLRQLSSARVVVILLEAWRSAGRDERQEIMNVLFGRQQWIEAIMSALEAQQILPNEIGTSQQQKLLNHSSSAIRERAARVFTSVTRDRDKIVEAYKIVAELKGDRPQGHKLFTQNCSTCHQLNGEGQNVGPDLGTMANKPIEEFVVAILDPNKAVDPAYTAYAVTTKDGRELSGILTAETPNSITLRMPGGSEELILRKDIRALRNSGRSLMPEGLETALKPQDMADLISYILSPQ